MAKTRQEVLPAKQYKPGPKKARATETDWSKMPDWSHVTINEALHLAALSKTALHERLAAGTFPKPGKEGNRLVWRLGAIRQWCEANAPEVE